MRDTSLESWERDDSNGPSPKNLYMPMCYSLFLVIAGNRDGLNRHNLYFLRLKTKLRGTRLLAGSNLFFGAERMHGVSLSLSSACMTPGSPWLSGWATCWWLQGGGFEPYRPKVMFFHFFSVFLFICLLIQLISYN